MRLLTSNSGRGDLEQSLIQQGRRRSLDYHVGSGLPSRVPRRPLYNMLMGWVVSIMLAYSAYLKFDYLCRAKDKCYFGSEGGSIGVAILVGIVGFVASIGIAAMSPQNDPRAITIDSDPQLTRQAIANNRETVIDHDSQLRRPAFASNNRETVPTGSEASSNVSDLWRYNDPRTSSDHETQSPSDYVSFASPLQ